MIQSFRCAETEKVFSGKLSRRLPQNLQRVMQSKLRILDAAVRLENLRVPPGNRLEALKGTRSGQHSIRVNDQFRICFRWTAHGPDGVEIVDYH